MTAARSLARGGLLVSGAFLVSRVLGFVRVFAITSTTHDAASLDPFFQAFRVPDLIFQLVAAGALSSALIPTIATLLAANEESRAWRVVSAVTNLMLIALAVLAGTLLVFAPEAVRAITPGFTGERLAETVELTRIMLLSPILLALGSVATSVLNARGRFAASVMAPIVYNVAIIAGAIFLAGPFGLRGLAVSVVLGSACHLAIQLRPLFAGAGFRYTPTLARDDPETKHTVLLLVPRAMEARILEALGVDYIDESEVLTPADEEHHIDKRDFKVPFVCGARNLGEALRRIGEGAAMIRTKGEAGSGNIVEAVRHMRTIQKEMKQLTVLGKEELMAEAKRHQAPFALIEYVAAHGKLPVPNFSAGGIATPADAALVMQLGAEAVFVGSGIFKSADPEARARAIVKAATYFNDPAKLLEASEDLGMGMAGLDISKLPESELMQTRGW